MLETFKDLEQNNGFSSSGILAFRLCTAKTFQTCGNLWETNRLTVKPFNGLAATCNGSFNG